MRYYDNRDSIYRADEIWDGFFVTNINNEDNILTKNAKTVLTRPPQYV